MGWKMGGMHFCGDTCRDPNTTDPHPLGERMWCMADYVGNVTWCTFATFKREKLRFVRTEAGFPTYSTPVQKVEWGGKRDRLQMDAIHLHRHQRQPKHHPVV